MTTCIIPLLITTPLGAILSASFADKLIKKSPSVVPEIKDEAHVLAEEI